MAAVNIATENVKAAEMQAVNASNIVNLKEIWDDLQGKINNFCGDFPMLVRNESPLVHLITNYVTVNDCVNALLAIGARGICSHALQEAAQVTNGSSALVCNLGGTEYYEAMESSAKQAVLSCIPLVIDPVGCAASTYRRNMCMHMIKEYSPTAIRGNYAEIIALIDENFISSGLDSKAELTQREFESLKSDMKNFAAENGLILIASGAADLCTDGKEFVEITEGTSAQKRITGAGCMSTSLLAAFMAVEKSFACAVSALRFIGICGEAAHKASVECGTGAGHFHMFFMDALSTGDVVWQKRSSMSDR